MNPRSKKSCGWALVLVALGLLALYGGPRRLALLVPAAILVWYAVVESGRGTTGIDATATIEHTEPGRGATLMAILQRKLSRNLQ